MQKMQKMKDVFECRVEVGVWRGEQGRKGRVRDWRNAGTRRTILEKHLNRLGLKERNFLFAETVKRKILGKRMSLIFLKNSFCLASTFFYNIDLLCNHSI